MPRTVFILGAGASMPYGFPSGERLVEQIKDNLKADSFVGGRPNENNIRPLLKILLKKFKWEFIKSFNNALKHSGTYSIDSFLTERDDYREIGKMCITYILAEFEFSSVHFNNLYQGDWYKLFWNKISIYKKSNKFDFVFYTFNYERSLEYYIYSAFKNLHNMDEEYIKGYFENGFFVNHLHGSLGGLDFQKTENVFKYGDIKYLSDPNNLLEISKNIDIIYEANVNDNFKKLHDDLVSAQNLVFLGFGFNKDNMKKLNIKKFTNSSKKNIYATTLGLTNAEIIEAFINDLGSISYKNIQEIKEFYFAKSDVITNKEYDCYRLLREYFDFNSLIKK